MSKDTQTPMFEEAKAQILMLPRTTQNWMLWMNVVFLVGLLFVFSHESARWVLAAYVVCFPVAVPIYRYTRDVAMMGISHILFWTPLLIYLPLEAVGDSTFSLVSLYGVWTVLLMLTITISVAFDARAVVDYLSRKRQD
ncbi:MAG: hypothetical protein AAFU53_00755 [Cyanobacteria bacterium J06632_3]